MHQLHHIMFIYKISMQRLLYCLFVSEEWLKCWRNHRHHIGLLVYHRHFGLCRHLRQETSQKGTQQQAISKVEKVKETREKE